MTETCALGAIPRVSEAQERTSGDACVIVPMFNEAAVITDVVTQLLGSFGMVVCVDDGSRDNSAQLAETAGGTVVRHPANLGQGAALQTGLDFALRHCTQHEYFVTFDADGQHRVSDALAMVNRARADKLDVVLGSRFLTSESAVPRSRRFVLRGAVAFTKMTTGMALTDAHNGLRVFNRTAAEGLRLRLAGMAHASEILAHIAREKLSFAEHPVSILYTDYSRAKGQPSINAFNIAFDVLVERLRRPA